MTNVFTLLFFIVIQLRVEQPLVQKYCPSKMKFNQVCPRCGSFETIKNGFSHHGKRKCQCKECSRQFVLNPRQKKVSDETKRLIDKLLLERISLRGIVRATCVSWSWLQNYVNHKFSQVPRQASISKKVRGKLIIECDELWSFVSSKSNQFYIWLAINLENHIGAIGYFIHNYNARLAKA